MDEISLGKRRIVRVFGLVLLTTLSSLDRVVFLFIFLVSSRSGNGVVTGS